MAIALVQGPIGISESDASVTKAWTSTPTAGNLLVAYGRGTNAISNSSIPGWSSAVTSAVSTGTSTAHGIFFKVAAAGEGSVTLDWTGSTRTVLAIMEWSGIVNAVLDRIAKTDNTGAVTSKSTNTTAATTANDELCIATVAQGAAVTSLTWSNSYVARAVAGQTDCYWASLVQTVIGTQETTASWTTSRVAGACIATFKAGLIGGGERIRVVNKQSIVRASVW